MSNVEGTPISNDFVPRGYASAGLTVVADFIVISLHICELRKAQRESSTITIELEDHIEDWLDAGWVRVRARLADGSNYRIEFIPPLTAALERWESELPSHYRDAFCYKEFRVDLSDNQLPSYILNDPDGQLVRVPPFYWNSSSAESVLLWDRTTTVEVDGRKICGRILFSIADLSTFWVKKGWLQPSEVSSSSAAAADLPEAMPPARLGGRPPRYDSDGLLIEAFRILYENRSLPKTQAELMRLALAAYAQRKLPGGRPEDEWAKKKIRRLCRELGINFGVE